MKYNSSKFFPVFKAGDYPQGNVTLDFINEVASNYDENFKKSPLTIDHQDGKSYAWIKTLKVEDDTLLASFDEVTDEAVTLTQSGNYRYPSVEFKEYERDGRKVKYLRAITLTNFNEVKNLPQLKFAEGIQAFKTNNLSINFIDKKELFVSFSEKTGIIFEENMTDEDKLNRVETKFCEMKNELESIKKQRIDELLENAAREGKIIPSDKENYRAFAEFNFELAKRMFSDMPVKEVLKPKQINSRFPEIAEITNPKFAKTNGTTYKYEEVIKDSKLMKKFNDEELAELKKGSETFRNSS